MPTHSLSSVPGPRAYPAYITARTYREKVIEGYADLFKQNGATHALTIALGLHPRRFDPETEFLPQLRRIAREITHQLREVPKRKLLKLRPEDAVFMAGFYEPRNGAGELYPHFHGVISLRKGEERLLRSVLTETVGADSSVAGSLLVPPSRPVISTPRAKPSFDLQPLTEDSRYIRYATKQVPGSDFTHWTIGDILGHR